MSALKRIRLTIGGIVQGVGFRPFLHRQAEERGVTGWVCNTLSGVEMEIEGQPEALSGFLKAVQDNPPPRAVIKTIQTVPLPEPAGFKKFEIRSSIDGEGNTLVSPDIGLCAACRKELTDPSDRRYRYPFINCTDCGPRFTIIRGLPYDRVKTTMAGFRMCATCADEYHDLSSRRYHAQPDCCPDCGPTVFFCGADGREYPGDAIEQAQQALRAGKILAVKGIGGIHLACDAHNESAVRLLRARKHRPEKPLAVMCRCLETARAFCEISDQEAKLLEQPQQPIVLLKKKKPEDFPLLSANRCLGIMLPYTPLHVLLLDGLFGGPDALVMTSANHSGQPIFIHNEEALAQLAGIADGFLLHNRPIQNRCDDSLVMEWQGREYFFRRSRGYVPRPLEILDDVTGGVAFGAEQKAAFAVGRERLAFLSPYIGDLKSLEVLDHYQESMEAFLKLFQVSPEFLACDLHPDFFSTRAAEERARRDHLPLFRVQHHWAHMAACMADNDLSGSVFGIIWDGTGLGTDGSIWGGEFLVGGTDHFTRCGSIRPVLLPGGEAAVAEIGRTALSLLWDAGISPDDAPIPKERQKPLLSLLDSRTRSPAASSVGRLFDGIYALITATPKVSYEGQGAVLLESLVRDEIPARVYPVEFYWENSVRRLDTRPLIRAVAADFHDGIPPAAIARGFMDTLCRMALDQCRALNLSGLPVVLSGGVFLNRYLLTEMTRLLTADGYHVYTHHRVSPSDEGVALGQLVIAAAQRRQQDYVSGGTA